MFRFHMHGTAVPLIDLHIKNQASYFAYVIINIKSDEDSI